jgi:hypothetical protein
MADMLERVGLSSNADHLVEELSQRQREWPSQAKRRWKTLNGSLSAFQVAVGAGSAVVDAEVCAVAADATSFLSCCGCSVL